MSKTNQIAFELKAKVEGREVGPANIGLSLFNRFNREVEHFITARQRTVSLDQARVTIEDGSYRLLVDLPEAVAAEVEPAVRLLQQEDALDRLDPHRAAIVQGWQRRARQEEGFQVSVSVARSGLKPVRISRDTDFHAADQDHWVAVEKYVLGRIVDIGGTTEANVHLVLDGSGQRIKAVSSEGYLRDQKQNYIYHRVQLQIAGEENLKTGGLKNVRLLAFVGEGPSYDEAELETLIEKGTEAWKGVEDLTAWVREQRGSYDD